MVKRRNQTTRKNRNRKGFCKKRPRPRKIGASTAYETCSEQLSPFGGLLPLIKFIDLVGFREIFHFAYRPPSRDPKLGHYLMMVGILMLLFIGFNRIWHFVYVRLDAMLCGFFKLSRLPAATTPLCQDCCHLGLIDRCQLLAPLRKRYAGGGRQQLAAEIRIPLQFIKPGAEEVDMPYPDMFKNAMV